MKVAAHLLATSCVPASGDWTNPGHDKDKYRLQPTLAQSTNTLAAILGSILQMSDRIKTATLSFDQQGKLLAMQSSIQKSGKRVLPYVQTVLAAVAVEASGAGGQGPLVAVDAVSAALLRQAKQMEQGELPALSGPEALRQFALSVGTLAGGPNASPEVENQSAA